VCLGSEELYSNLGQVKCVRTGGLHFKFTDV
jgi:hypothetical protein